MINNEFIFSIDAYSPATIPMARLAEYMSALADLVGFKESTHFLRLDEGSACLVHTVEARDIPKVHQRLVKATTPDASKDAAKAFAKLDEMLSNDNAIGEIVGPEGNVLIPFPGRNRHQPLAFPAVRQNGSIDGQIVNIGGRDKTAHIILQDGPITYTNIDLSRELAKELAAYLYDGKIRLIGSGRWERHFDGTWKLSSFSVDRHEVLDETSLSEVLETIRALPGNNLANDPNAYQKIMSIRLGDDEVH